MAAHGDHKHKLLNYFASCNIDLFTVYVDELTELLFSLSSECRKAIFEKYSKQVPDSLTSSFTERVGREDAILAHSQRKVLRVELFPTCKSFHLVSKFES